MPNNTIAIGEIVEITLPCSEVCMHLKVAGKQRTVQILAKEAQILDDEGHRFSAPITHTEAGIRHDENGLLYLQD